MWFLIVIENSSIEQSDIFHSHLMTSPSSLLSMFIFTGWLTLTLTYMWSSSPTWEKFSFTKVETGQLRFPFHWAPGFRRLWLWESCVVAKGGFELVGITWGSAWSASIFITSHDVACTADCCSALQSLLPSVQLEYIYWWVVTAHTFWIYVRVFQI